MESGGHSPDGTRFAVLGPLQAERDGKALELGGPKLRVLLAALLLSPNRVVPVSRLIDILWGDDAGERSQPTLHVYIAKLRKAIGSHREDGTALLETIRPGYRISVDDESLDLLAFDTLAVQAREAMARDDHEEASGHFRRALGMVRGPLVADLPDEEFVLLERHAFDRSVLAVTTDAYGCELMRGRHAEVVGNLERFVVDHPLDERISGLLMLALYRSGRQVEALEVYRRLRETLGDELGIEPGPDMQALEVQVLNHDPALSSPGLRPFDEPPPTVTRTSTTATKAYLVANEERVPVTRGVTTIGRLRDQAVVLTDPDASRRHAEVRRTGSGFVLVDVGSTNGTLVNGRRIFDHLLRPGDRIEIGDTVILFEAD